VFADKAQTILKLVDFGCAVEAQTDNSFSGTCEYMPPEAHAIDRTHYNNKVDTWTTGVLIFVLLTGFSPFGSSLNRNAIHYIKTRPVNFDKIPCNNVHRGKRCAWKCKNGILDIRRWRKCRIISTECKEFVKELLQKKPTDRPSIEDVIKRLNPQWEKHWEAYKTAHNLGSWIPEKEWKDHREKAREAFRASPRPWLFAKTAKSDQHDFLEKQINYDKACEKAEEDAKQLEGTVIRKHYFGTNGTGMFCWNQHLYTIDADGVLTYPNNESKPDRVRQTVFG